MNDKAFLEASRHDSPHHGIAAAWREKSDKL